MHCGFTVWRSTGIAILAALIAPPSVLGQTPSPLQEWQYSGGVILERMFESNPPNVHAVLGLGAALEPAYEGSRADRVRGGPVFDIRYKDLAFISTGEGVGYNVVHRRRLQIGLGVAYDLGRKERLDYDNLTGMGDKKISAVPKVSLTWVVSDQFPMVVRSDVRHLLRTGGGTVGDLGAYFPLPGSSEKVAAFLGPSVTIGSRRYLQDLYGVTDTESLASGHPLYTIQNVGVDAYGIGLSATWRITPHYLFNVDAAANRLGHVTADSPLTERRSSHAIALSIDYHWK